MLGLRLPIIVMLCILTGTSGNGVYAMRHPDPNWWLNRVIPLPKQCEIAGSVNLRADKIALSCPASDSPCLATASKLLRSFSLGDAGASFTIRMALVGDEGSDYSRRVRTRLPTLPNSEQAYAIVPMDDGAGLLLLANSDLGLLYAARTLTQMIRPSKEVTSTSELEIPLVRITDWPDLSERGQWGGNTPSDLPWTSQWKMNVLEVASKDPALYRRGTELGVKVVPMIVHLEQIPIPAEFKDRPGIRRVPDPSKSLPSDYRESLCMSSPDTRELIGKWLMEYADIGGVTDIMVWLSEDMTACFCERCSGKQPYDLEVACILGAFEKVRAKQPNVRLRLLTTQGSYPVNDLILAAVPPDVGVSYYDGGRTYSSSRQPMIYPLLEGYAKSGRWLGVYPQITHSWRVVFPWTAPQFIRYRAGEFVDKKLKCMIGYAVPSNRFHEFNVMAMAEWTWNSRGRSPEEFARAYAVVTGISDPDLFAQWAVKAGDAGWSLAESNLMLRLIYDPAVGLGGDVPFDHRFQQSEISDVAKLDEKISSAREALELAKKSGSGDMICESECLLAGLEAFRDLGMVSTILSSSSPVEIDKKALNQYMNKLNGCASILNNRLVEWGERICGGAGEKLPTRLLDTASVLFRTCDAVDKAAEKIGVPDQSTEYRLRKLGEWSAADFAGGETAVRRFDIGEMVPDSGGDYHVCFDYIDSAYGADIKKIVVLRRTKSGEDIFAQTPDVLRRVSRWERWCEMRIAIPARAQGDSLFLEVELSGLPKDAPEGRGTCSGSVGIRRVPRTDDIVSGAK